jgi:hypothetical protein
VNGSSNIYICDNTARVIRNTLCLHFHAVTDQIIEAVSLLTWVWEMPASNTSTDTDYTNCSLSWISQTRQTNVETTPYIETNSLPSTSLSNLSIPYNFELMTVFSRNRRPNAISIVKVLLNNLICWNFITSRSAACTVTLFRNQFQCH